MTDNIKELTFPDGVTRKVMELSFGAEGGEPWTEYTLSDGTKLRIKTTILKVFRVIDSAGNPDYTAEGDPNILVRSKNELVASE